MSQSSVFLHSPSPHSGVYEPRRREYEHAGPSYDQLSVGQPSTYSPSSPAFYDLSTPRYSEDASTSPYWIRSVPTAAAYPASSLNPRGIFKRDVGNDTTIASLVMTGVVGTISIYFQAKANSIAAASYQLALASRDGAVDGIRAVGSGVVVTGHRVGGAIGESTVAVGSAAGSVASGIVQAGRDTVVNGVSAMSTASRWLPKLPSTRFNFPSFNPFARRPLADDGAEPTEPQFPDGDVRRLPDGTLELFRILEDSTTERIAILDESLFPTIASLTHGELVQAAIEIADQLFEIGSDTATDRTDGDTDLDIGMAVVELIPAQQNPWAD